MSLNIWAQRIERLEIRVKLPGSNEYTALSEEEAKVLYEQLQVALYGEVNMP